MEAERQGLQEAFIYKNSVHSTAKAINKSIYEWLIQSIR